jgi:hypothetical protein
MGENVPKAINEESSLRKEFYKFRQDQMKVLRSGDYQFILENATNANNATQNSLKFNDFLKN